MKGMLEPICKYTKKCKAQRHSQEEETITCMAETPCYYQVYTHKR